MMTLLEIGRALEQQVRTQFPGAKVELFETQQRRQSEGPQSPVIVRAEEVQRGAIPVRRSLERMMRAMKIHGVSATNGIINTEGPDAIEKMYSVDEGDTTLARVFIRFRVGEALLTLQIHEPPQVV